MIGRIIAVAACLGLASTATSQTRTTSAQSRPQSPSGPGIAVSRAQFIADMDAEFKRMDSDANRIVTRTEIEAVLKPALAAREANRNRRLFVQLDKDRNGQLSAAEFAILAANPPPPNSIPYMTNWDTNRDGKIELVEYRAATQNNFDRLDTDRDGVVSAAEMRRGGIIK